MVASQYCRVEMEKGRPFIPQYLPFAESGIPYLLQYTVTKVSKLMLDSETLGK